MSGLRPAGTQAPQATDFGSHVPVRHFAQNVTHNLLQLFG
jgi:hypothetical protein